MNNKAAFNNPLTAIDRNMLVIVLLATSLYWIYLIFTSSMTIDMDALGYQNLGQLLHEHGWISYFNDSPKREPLFPLSIAGSMWLGGKLGVSYQLVQKFLHGGIVLWSQVLLFFLMRRLKMSALVMGAVLLYFGFSPAIVNSGMSLFSEIWTYPFVLLTVISVIKAHEEQDRGIGHAAVLAIACVLSALGIIFVKAVFEWSCIVFFIPVLFLAARSIWFAKQRAGWSLVIFFMIVMGGVGIICHMYKMINQRQNGYYYITDHRGPFAVYGNAMRRIEPVTSKKVGIASSSMLGDRVCRKIFTQQECLDWSFVGSDTIGQQHSRDLSRRGMADPDIGRQLIHDALLFVQEHPLRYGLFFSIEYLKNFFWESTKIAFVSYPDWLQNIYENQVCRYGIRSVLAVFSFFGFVYTVLFLFSSRRNDSRRYVLFWVVWMVMVWGLSLSFVSILTRYTFPVAPLYLVLIGFAFDNLLARKTNS